MFAKIFSQIFDSSIAEDYHCRRMFMDLLVLADSEGTVDMTIEAISRRTNVPIDEVKRCIEELSQPDPSSRTKLHHGRRLVPLDAARDWGWQIVNYKDYRRIRDQEARREYFREQKRRQRQKTHVQDKKVDSGGRCQIVPSSSTSSSKSKCTREEVEQYCSSIGLPRSDGTAMFLHWEEKGWAKIKDWKLTIQKWQSFGYLPSQKQKAGLNFAKTKLLADPNQQRREEAQERHWEKVQEKKRQLGEITP